MDLQTIREKTGLDGKQFVAKLKPFLDQRRTNLTETMLAKIENGGSISDDRTVAIVESIKEAFPEFAEEAVTVHPKKRKFKMSANLVTLIAFVLFSAGACALYYFTREKALVVEITSIFASVAGVIGLIYAVRKLSS